MNLYYLPEFTESQPLLHGPEAHHALNVLRHKPGDVLHITNGKGTRYDCIILSAGRSECRLSVSNITYTDRQPEGIHIAVGILKNSDRMEWLVEKVTEIGATSLSFLRSEKTERATINRERLQRSAISAIKQSGRLWLPDIRGPLNLTDLLSALPASKFIAYAGHKEAGKLIDLVPATGDVLVLIGPEGDFSASEFNLAVDHGFTPVSLGPATLRTETAAMVAAAAVNMARDSR